MKRAGIIVVIFLVVVAVVVYTLGTNTRNKKIPASVPKVSVVTPSVSPVVSTSPVVSIAPEVSDVLIDEKTVPYSTTKIVESQGVIESKEIVLLKGQLYYRALITLDTSVSLEYYMGFDVYTSIAVGERVKVGYQGFKNGTVYSVRYVTKS